MQPFISYKIHGSRLLTKTRNAKNNTYLCDAVAKGAIEGDSSGVPYYGVLEEVLKV